MFPLLSLIIMLPIWQLYFQIACWKNLNFAIHIWNILALIHILHSLCSHSNSVSIATSLLVRKLGIVSAIDFCISYIIIYISIYTICCDIYIRQCGILSNIYKIKIPHCINMLSSSPSPSIIQDDVSHCAGSLIQSILRNKRN